MLLAEQEDSIYLLATHQRNHERVVCNYTDQINFGLTQEVIYVLLENIEDVVHQAQAAVFEGTSKLDVALGSFFLCR